MAKTVLFEGDSWFAYHGEPWNTSNIYAKFIYINEGRPAQKKYTIYSQPHSANHSSSRRPISKNGDTIKDIASAKNKELRRILRGFNVWALVISGGGNDIIQALKSSGLLLQYQKGNIPVADRFNPIILKKLLQNIRKDYKKIITYCNKSSKNEGIHIVTHDYVLFKPSGIPSKVLFGLAGLKGVGPWIKPVLLRRKKYPPNKINTVGQDVCDYLMGEFSKVLQDLAQENKNFHLVRTQKIKGLPNRLVDELHLGHKGCLIVARKIMNQLDKLP